MSKFIALYQTLQTWNKVIKFLFFLQSTKHFLILLSKTLFYYQTLFNITYYGRSILMSKNSIFLLTTIHFSVYFSLHTYRPNLTFKALYSLSYLFKYKQIFLFSTTTESKNSFNAFTSSSKSAGVKSSNGVYLKYS